MKSAICKVSFTISFKIGLNFSFNYTGEWGFESEEDDEAYDKLESITDNCIEEHDRITEELLDRAGEEGDDDENDDEEDDDDNSGSEDELLVDENDVEIMERAADG